MLPSKIANVCIDYFLKHRSGQCPPKLGAQDQVDSLKATTSTRGHRLSLLFSFDDICFLSHYFGFFHSELVSY